MDTESRTVRSAESRTGRTSKTRTTENMFIHFGCWNKGGCPTESPLTHVMMNLAKETPSFFSICGDNYYPLKVTLPDKTKKKYLDEDELISGFNCLPKNIPIYMTFGNHDFETKLIVGNTTEHDCTLTTTEMQIVKNTFKNIHLGLNQHTSFGDKTKILFLETTIWDSDNTKEYEPCYEKVDSTYKTIDDVKKDQLDFIRRFVDTQIEEHTENIIIVGHHPLALLKEKKDKVKLFILNEAFNHLLYAELYKKCTPEMKYYYLCADLHHYQPGTIIINSDMRIEQHIVGTGGAELDTINKERVDTSDFTQGNIEYNIKLEKVVVDYGYLKCRENDGSLSFSFINRDYTRRKKRRKTCRKKRRKTRRKN